MALIAQIALGVIIGGLTIALVVIRLTVGLFTSACRPAIAYSRLGTGRTPSAMPSSSNFPASHLRSSELGLIAQSYRAFSSPPLGRGAPQPPRMRGFQDSHVNCCFLDKPDPAEGACLAVENPKDEISSPPSLWQLRRASKK